MSAHQIGLGYLTPDQDRQVAAQLDAWRAGKPLAVRGTMADVLSRIGTSTASRASSQGDVNLNKATRSEGGK